MMLNNDIYLIYGGIILYTILVMFLAISSYRTKKRALMDEEKAMRIRIQEEEKASQEKIRIAQASLNNQQEEFRKQVEKFTREQKLREDISKKTDREIVVEMHVKAMRIFSILSDLDDKLIGVKDYSSQIASFSKSVEKTVYDLKESMSSSVMELSSELDSSFSNIESVIYNAVSQNSSDIDTDDIRTAVSDALDYDCYSFKSDLERKISDIVDSKISDLEWKLDSIESKLND